MTNTLITYVRGKKFNLEGVIVAHKDSNNQTYIGWSKAHTKSDGQGTFNKSRGKEIAMHRATQTQQVRSAIRKADKNPVIPYSFKSPINKMIFRAKRYFKTNTVFVYSLDVPHN